MAKHKVEDLELKTEPTYQELKDQIEIHKGEIEKLKAQVQTKVLEKEVLEKQLEKIKNDPFLSREGLDKFHEQCYEHLYLAKTLLKGGTGLFIKNHVLPVLHEFMGQSKCEEIEFKVLNASKPH